MERFSQDIEEHTFSSGLRGYDRTEVDAFMDETARRVGVLEETLRSTEVNEANSLAETLSLKASIDTLLQEATDARRTIIDEAREEARSIVEGTAGAQDAPETLDVATAAATIVSQAEAEAALIRVEASSERRAAEESATATEHEANAHAAHTRTEADRLLDEARADANAIRAETQKLSMELNAQMSDIRGLLAEATILDLRESTLSRSKNASETDKVIDLRGGAASEETLVS